MRSSASPVRPLWASRQSFFSVVEKARIVSADRHRRGSLGYAGQARAQALFHAIL